MIDTFIESMMATYHAPGLSLAVLRDGEPLVARGYGFANVEHEVAADEHTVYEIASVTKTFTAAAVMQLVEAGRLALSDPLGAYLPGLPAAWNEVSIHALLTHSAGIPNYTDVAAYWRSTRLDVSRQTILGLVWDAPLQFAPGSEWAYSNTGYYLLGMLLEQIHGASFGDVIEAQIARPLGLSATVANDPYAIVKRRAAGYTWAGDQLRNVEYYSASGTYAAGVLLSSIHDLGTWCSALLSGALLHPSTVEQMWSPQLSHAPAEGKHGFRMGLGWFIFQHAGRRVVRHRGGIKGFGSEIAIFPDEGLSIALCCNSDQGLVEADTILAVADLFL